MKEKPTNIFTKKIESRYSGIVEIAWLNGKKVLNSENANYSYGALEHVLDFGLSHAPADRSGEILVLGLGGGSVLPLLRNKFCYYGKITAVEIDPVILDIAMSEFKIMEFEHLELVCEDALEYVKKSSGKYGLIILDVFINREVPEAFYSAEFWKDAARLIKDCGTILFNAGITFGNKNVLDQFLKELPAGLDFTKMETGTNVLLIGTKI